MTTGVPIFDPDKKGGSLRRRTGMTAAQLVEHCAARRREGLSFPAIARELGCHHSTVIGYVRAADAGRTQPFGGRSAHEERSQRAHHR